MFELIACAIVSTGVGVVLFWLSDPEDDDDWPDEDHWPMVPRHAR